MKNTTDTTKDCYMYDSDSPLISRYAIIPDSCFSRQEGIGWEIKLYGRQGWSKTCGKCWRSPFSTREEAIQEALGVIQKYTKLGYVPSGLFQ